MNYFKITEREFENLFKDFFNPLINFIFRYLKNYEDSREVVQLTFAKLWNNKEKLQISTSIKSYIYSTAKNTMIDYIRQNKKHFNTLEVGNAMDIEDVGEEMFDIFLVRSIIEKSLDKLKPKTKEIFILNKFEGLTYEEVANYLGVSKRTVEDHMAKSLSFLKEELKNNDELF